MSESALALFLLASLALAATPGPGVLYIVARTLAQGRRAGLASVGGVALGNFGNALGVSLGLAALFALSSVAFTLVKFAGAGYLVYLGALALRARPGASGPSNFEAPRLARTFRDGFVVALLNPKTTLFFAAFLPQFIGPAASPLAQGVALGAAFVLIAACTDTAYVLAAGAASRAFGTSGRAGSVARYAAASVYIGLGVCTAFAGTRGGK